MNNQKYSTLSDKPLPPLPQNNKSIEMDIQVPPVYDIDQLMVEQSNEFKSIDSVPFKSEKEFHVVLYVRMIIGYYYLF
ncbi:hypothetical protein QTN25_005586 [Entamoeba marina]